MAHRLRFLDSSLLAISVVLWGCGGTSSSWAPDSRDSGQASSTHRDGAMGLDGPADTTLTGADGSADGGGPDSPVSDAAGTARVDAIVTVDAQPRDDTAANRDGVANEASNPVDGMQADADAAPVDAPVDATLRDARVGTVDSAAGEVPGSADGRMLGTVDSLPIDEVGATDTAAPSVRTLSLVLQGGPWKSGQNAKGLTADAGHRVYRMDDNNIYMVAGTSVSTYFTLDEATSQVGLESAAHFLDLDMGPDGLLYIMLIGTKPTTGGSATIVAQSGGPHLATKWRDLSTYTASRLSVISSGQVGFIDYSGFWTATAQSQSLVYAASLLKDTNGCAAQCLVTNPSGVFLYEPGCNGYPILRGNIDGSGVAVLYEVSPSPIQGGNFLCSARDPAGGFYVMVDNVDGSGIRMYHITENASGTTGLTHIVTEPSFGEAKDTQNELGAFTSCSLATAPDGTIYFQTMSQLWKVSP